MTDFEKRLEKAIRRGERASDARARAEAEKALSQQELRRLHTQYRLELSEHIEDSLQKLARLLPGFDFDVIHSDRGWGAAVSRDDVQLKSRRQRTNLYSRLEIFIRPASKYLVFELAGKGTVRNKEYFNWSHYERLADVDLTSFVEMADRWVLQYAELYTAKS